LVIDESIRFERLSFTCLTGDVSLRRLDVFHVPQGLTAAEIAANSPHKYLTGNSDVQLAHSLNGVSWKRTSREPMIPNGPPGSLSAGLLYPSSIQRTPERNGSSDPAGQQIIITASASALEHGLFSYKNGSGSGAMLSYSLRKDGFVFLESSGGIGLVGTRILWLSLGEISVNLNARTGRVRCRVTDHSNKPLTGYDWGDSVPCEGCDTLAWIPQWKQRRNLSSLAGRGSDSVIRLEFEMVNARLYSLEGQFAPLSSPEVRGPFPPIARPGFEPGWW
jgi:hypothetical protein